MIIKQGMIMSFSHNIHVHARILIALLRRFQQCFNHITGTAHIIHAFLAWVSSVLGWGSELSCPRTFPTTTKTKQKKKKKQWDSNLGVLDYESSTLRLSHTGPLIPHRSQGCFLFFFFFFSFPVRLSVHSSVRSSFRLSVHPSAVEAIFNYLLNCPREEILLSLPAVHTFKRRI